ncbi:MAG: S9 family peptidase [Phycisphaeraceae bacterium]|nr:S9 family peptidase [Phycisphaeraceae bacterium]
MSQSPPLIPRTLLFGNPSRSGPKISPDGRHLVYLAPDERQVLQVWLAGANGQPDRVLTRDPKRGIRMFSWTFLPDQLMYLQDAEGDENYHLFLVHLGTGLVRDLTPFQGVRAELVALHHQNPRFALVAMNINDRAVMDVYRLDLVSGAVELDTRNPGNALSYTAHELNIRAVLVSTDDGGQDLLLRQANDEPWRNVQHWGPDEQGKPVSFSLDGKTLYLLGNHNFDTMRLLAHDIQTGNQTVLAQDLHFDAEGVMTHPTRQTVQAVSFHRDKYEWEFLDDDLAADFQPFRQIHQGEMFLQSRDLADTTWIVSLNFDHGQPHYYRYDRPRKKASFLFAGHPELDQYVRAHKQSIRVTARDGLTLHGYLTLPVDVEPRNLPLVLYVHGGPWMRDGWGFWSVIQWLANRGYAVLQVNFRGSSGYGKAHLSAGNHQWGAAMHHDLLDAVGWVIDRKIADPQRVAIMGASYGGYATLAGLTFTPDFFCAGVDLVGPSNIVTLLKTTPPYWKPMLAMIDRRVGNPYRDEESLKSRSPLFFADRIKRPLLIGQGANDPRVKQAESDQIVAAMRKASLPVEYVIYADEGHTLARPPNRLHFYALAEKFLATHLGGRCEPMGDIPGHSGQMR